MKYFNFDQVISRDNSDSIKYAGRMESFGRADLIPLWVADMDFPVIPQITEALKKRIEHPIYGYTRVPVQLYDSTIRWFKNRHQWEISKDNLLLSPGVVPAFYTAVRAYTNPGDYVIIQPPVYNPFFTAVTQTKRRLLLNPLRYSGGDYEIDFEHFEKCASKAKLFIFCSPHNPIGKVWSRNELSKLVEISQKYNLIIFSDEIHCDLIFSQSNHTILASLNNNYDRILSAHSPSKTFNIPGLGLSTITVTNPILRKQIEDEFNCFPIKSYNPLSMVAFMAAYNEGEIWLAELLLYLEETKQLIEEEIKNNLPKIRVVSSQGTYLLWLDCRDFNMSDQQLHDFFTNKALVGLSPGTLFGSSGGGFMRLNFGAPRSILIEALSRIKKAYDEVFS